MEEISLHILDIAENSVMAQAKLIEIVITEDSAKDIMEININDDGRGMDEETILKALSPFYSSRTTRRIGLGLPLFKATCEATGGWLTIYSTPGKGTKVNARLGLSHIDKPPLGDIAGTILMLVISYPDRDFYYKHIVNDKEFLFDTKEIREVLGEEIELNNPELRSWLTQTLNDGELSLYKT